eukprot:scaffold215133_cov39-Tisochrysis_lutea.AAC.1
MKSSSGGTWLIQYMTAAGLLYEPDVSFVRGLAARLGWTNVGPIASEEGGYTASCASEHASSRVMGPGMRAARWDQ